MSRTMPTLNFQIKSNLMKLTPLSSVYFIASTSLVKGMICCYYSGGFSQEKQFFPCTKRVDYQALIVGLVLKY